MCSEESRGRTFLLRSLLAKDDALADLRAWQTAMTNPPKSPERHAGDADDAWSLRDVLSLGELLGCKPAEAVLGQDSVVFANPAVAEVVRYVLPPAARHLAATPVEDAELKRLREALESTGDPALGFVAWAEAGNDLAAKVALHGAYQAALRVWQDVLSSPAFDGGQHNVMLCRISEQAGCAYLSLLESHRPVSASMIADYVETGALYLERALESYAQREPLRYAELRLGQASLYLHLPHEEDSVLRAMVRALSGDPTPPHFDQQACLTDPRIPTSFQESAHFRRAVASAIEALGQLGLPTDSLRKLLVP
jgi:hypothetical protein